MSKPNLPKFAQRMGGKRPTPMSNLPFSAFVTRWRLLLLGGNKSCGLVVAGGGAGEFAFDFCKKEGGHGVPELNVGVGRHIQGSAKGCVA